MSSASVLSIASICRKESAESIEYSAGTEEDLQLDSTFRRTGIEMESFDCEMIKTYGTSAGSLTICKEFFLFELLSKNQGHIISRERIIDYVWDKHHYVAPNTIDVYVSRLRKKLRTLKKHWNISTIPCLGYSLEQLPSLQSV